jgi:hypothetical protein
VPIQPKLNGLCYFPTLQSPAQNNPQHFSTSLTAPHADPNYSAPPYKPPSFTNLPTASPFYCPDQLVPKIKMLSQNFMLEQDPLSLDRIRSILVRLEDTIIFDLIERAQFAHNPRMYIRSAFPELQEMGFQGSWLDWFLKEIETFHGSFVSYLFLRGSFTHQLVTHSQSTQIH